MVEILKDFYKFIPGFDLTYLMITIFSLIKCSKKGLFKFIAASKWLLAYVLTLILFPRAKPFVEDFIQNEYILDIILGISIFILIIFLILMINKGISKAVKYSGLGKLDTVFGILFWIFKRLYYLCMYIFNY